MPIGGAEGGRVTIEGNVLAAPVRENERALSTRIFVDHDEVPIFVARGDREAFAALTKGDRVRATGLVRYRSRNTSAQRCDNDLELVVWDFVVVPEGRR